MIVFCVLVIGFIFGAYTHTEGLNNAVSRLRNGMRDSGNRQSWQSSWLGSSRPEEIVERERRRINAIRAAAISYVLIVSSLLIALVLVKITLMQAPTTVPPCRAAQFWVTEETRTTATVEFRGFCTDPLPQQLVIRLQRGNITGTYVFNSNLNGTVLTLVSGTNVGTITYFDYERIGIISAGDELYITNLDPGTSYTVRLHWEDLSTLDADSFTTRID